MTAPMTSREALLETAEAGLRHAEGLSAQLAKPDWKPGRAHIEQARNSIQKLAELLRGTDAAQGGQDPYIADLEFANRANIKRAREFKAVVDWVETWVCNPVGSYSVGALDGLFGMTRDKIAALSPMPSTDQGSK